MPESSVLNLVRLGWAGTFLIAGSLVLHAERLPIKSYTIADGLGHNTVRRIVRDSRGFLWFCTDEGVSRFDGHRFVNYGSDQGLPRAVVNDLLETRSGDYWVATDDGLVRFDPKARPMFTTVAPTDQDRRARTITVLFEAGDGTIWAGSRNDLYRLDDARGHPSLRRVEIGLTNEYSDEREIVKLVEDEQGSLWIATALGLFRRWPDGRAVRYTVRDGLPAQYLSDLFEDHDKHLWAATREGGVFRFHADDSHPPVIDASITMANGLLNNWVTCLFETSDRRLWAGTIKGLSEILPNAAAATRAHSYSMRNGLPDPSILALAEDLGGNLWIGTSYAGALKLAKDGFTTYGDRDGIRKINAIFEDRVGNLSFRGEVLGDTLPSGEPSTVLKFGYFDGQRFHWFFPKGPEEPGWVLEGVTLQARSGEWWIGTNGGLYRFAATDRFDGIKTAGPLALYGMGEGLAAPQVYRLFEDSHANIWISTTSSAINGLARWDARDGRVHDLKGAAGLPSLTADLPRSFGEDAAANIWIGFNGGLVRSTPSGFTLFTPSDGLPRGSILDIHLDRAGHLWLASARAGLIRVDHVENQRPTFVSYTTADGLSSNTIEVIAEDAAGHLYLGGGHGLDRFDPATGHVKQFTDADGLPAAHIKAGFQDRHGVLWFGTTSGLARLVPGPDATPSPPDVLIDGVQVRGISYPISALGEGHLSLGDLAPDQNQVQIEFGALAFGAGEVLRYQYRLEGADNDWSALSGQRTVTYASLSPGRYTFVVRAMNSDGIVSAAPASIAFTILSPIWLRAWFLAAVAAAAALLVYSMFRYRLRRVLEMANMRTRIATDLHDDIGANLTRIAMLSETAQAHGADRSSDPGGSLASIAGIARESVSSMSDIVWAINPRRDSLLDLTRRMRQHAEELFTQRGIALRFDAPVEQEALKLSVDVRRDLLLIFKELVNNAARHSGCSRVEIDFHVKGARLILAVVDNGVGFDTSVASEGQGLTSMKRRAQRLKGAFEIASTTLTGTSVFVSVPI